MNLLLKNIQQSVHRSTLAQEVECQTAYQATQIRIPANINEFFLSVFLAPGGPEPT